MRAKDRTGLVGEDKAAEYLIANGHQLLERRWCTPIGELDLITLDGHELVAVEVKTRRGLDYGHPFEAISELKLRRLQRLLMEYAAHVPIRPARRRIDAIAILLHPGNIRADTPVSVEHLKDLP